MTVNISAAFKNDERVFNGLETITKDLIENPLERHVIVAWVECVRITKDVADGMTETPTVKLTHVEVMLSDAEEKDARALLEKAYKARTGGAGAPQAELFDDGTED